jgi:hypothetical protein
VEGGSQLGVAHGQEAIDWDRGDDLWEVVGNQQALDAQDRELGMIESGQDAEVPAAAVAEVRLLNVQAGHLAQAQGLALPRDHAMQRA